MTPCGPGAAGERAFVDAERPSGLHQPSLRTHSLWIRVPTPSNTLSSCFPDVRTIANHGLLLDPGFADPPCASIFLAWPSPRHVALSSIMQPRGAARPCLKAGWRGSTQKQQYMVHQRSTASGHSACYAAKFLARQQVRAVPWGHRQPPPMRCSKPSNALKTWTRMGSLSFVTVPRTGRSPAASSWQHSACQGATARGLVYGH